MPKTIKFSVFGEHIVEKQRSLDTRIRTILNNISFQQPVKITANVMICLAAKDSASFVPCSLTEDGQIGFWHNIPLFQDNDMLMEDGRIITECWIIDVENINEQIW